MIEAIHSKSFLVTCVGAYDDSGVGTGGFVCVCNGESHVIDRIDSTGLFHFNETYYRFVRSRRSVVGYSSSGIQSIVWLGETRDGHDILVSSNGYVSVSTGNNEVCWYDAFGRLTRRWHADGENDAWHLNCLATMNGDLYISAFGEFKTHRGWNTHSTNAGFIVSLTNGQKVMTGLSGPHNPRYVDGTWVVCESHERVLTIQEKADRLHRVRLDGFTRGLAYDHNFYYVGESANRKGPIVYDYSHIAIVDRRNYTVLGRIRIPFPEIYEIVQIPDAFAEQIMNNPARFQFEQPDERISALEKQVQRGFDEVTGLRKELQQFRSGFFYRLKRKLKDLLG